jgi:primosomal protein N'
VILCSSPDEQALAVGCDALYREISGMTGDADTHGHALESAPGQEDSAQLSGILNGTSGRTLMQLVGPADASISKINDIYRKVIYLKTGDYDKLIAVKDAVEKLATSGAIYKNINIQFDFNPMSGF